MFTVHGNLQDGLPKIIFFGGAGGERVLFALGNWGGEFPSEKSSQQVMPSILAAV